MQSWDLNLLFYISYTYIVAPIKALCSERYTDWNDKFGPLGLTCCELTGDTEMDDYFELQRANIITTTPVSLSIRSSCFWLGLDSNTLHKFINVDVLFCYDV